MKRLLQFCLLLVFYQTAAQTDFSNEYMITVSGGVYYGGDLSSGCGSRYDVILEFEDGSTQTIVSNGHGGGGTVSFYRKFSFRSDNRVRRVIAFGKAHRQSPRYRSCGYRRIDEGNIYLPLDLNTDYPCVNRLYRNVFRGFNSSDITIDIQPVAQRLTTTLSMPNNATNRRRTSYALDAMFTSGGSDRVFSGYLDSWGRSTTVNRKDSIVLLKSDVRSVLLTTAGQTVNGRIVRNFNTSHSFDLPAFTNTLDVTFPFNLFPDAPAGSLRVVYRKIKFPLKYGPNTSYILPSDTSNRVVLLGPRGNPASFYHWVYSWDGVNWTNLPAKFQGRNRLEISGYDILGNEFWKYHNNNIFFKIIVDCNGAESETLTLSARLSAPNIVSLTPDPDRCYDKPQDGSFKVVFDRPLHVSEAGEPERLTILVTDAADNTVTIDQLIDVTLEADNSFSWPRRLFSDRNYQIRLLGKFKEVPTFTDNPVNHARNVELIRPRPITSTLTPEAVHCYNGGDGKILLTADGGVGNYRFQYLPVGATDSVLVTFSEATTHTLEFLRYGVYGFKVMDGNQCMDAARAKAVLVNQPTDSLHIGFSKTTDPLAYHYKDGYIETILVGGTPFPDQSYAVQWFDPVNLLPDSLYNNAPLAQGYQANIDSLGDGRYQLRAYDSQYTVAHPDHRKGCMVVSDTFRLIEPPPIVVAIAEWHFVSCHGYDDGELVAHAKGGVPYTSDLPYRYEWLKDVNGTPQSITQQDSIATQLRTGIYRVRIRDKNNIARLSDPFLLVEPDVLTAAVTTTPISCSSGTDGTAQVASTGGTLPYTYSWSDGATTALNVNLIEGRYFVLVKDVRGCTATANGSVVSPSPLQVDSLLTNPQCFGYENGSINITVIQGTPPYRYSWSNGAETEDIDQLPAGVYTVRITDDNDCVNYRRYELIDPAPVHVDLGKDRTLCTDQVYIADATIDDPGAQYQWSGPNGFIAQTSIVTISEDGTYTVHVVDSRECHGEDAIAIRRIQVNIGAEFIVTTQAFKDKLVTLVNISDPQPDSVAWWASDGDVQFALSLINKAELTFTDTGTYTVYMRAYRQGCEKDFSKPIVVVAGTFDEGTKDESPFLEEFTVFPNPSDGKFSAIIGLREQTPIRIRMISVASNVIVDDREALGSQRYELPYDLNLASGVYFLLLETAKGNYILRVTIY